MIELCHAAGLPEPQFEQRSGSFVLILWRDWLTDAVLSGCNLNERQLQAVSHAKVNGRINNSQYRKMAGASERTALRELRHLIDIGIFSKVGGIGQSAHYVIAKAKSMIGREGGKPS